MEKLERNVFDLPFDVRKAIHDDFLNVDLDALDAYYDAEEAAGIDINAVGVRSEMLPVAYAVNREIIAVVIQTEKEDREIVFSVPRAEWHRLVEDKDDRSGEGN